jgi:hypothetical protein
MARVWTTSFDATKHSIYADDWAAVLPEGLSFAAIASCGTAGPYLGWSRTPEIHRFDYTRTSPSP